MARIILHIGTHKTATTSIQRHLAANRKALAAKGIWYPNYDIIGKGSHYAHLGMVNAYSSQHDKFSVEDARSFFKEVVSRSSDYEATILSAEPFYRHVAYENGGGVPSQVDEYWRLRERYITQIRELFKPAAPELVIVFRRQADYAHSLYQEQVKTTLYRRTFAEFRHEFWWHFDYLTQSRIWAKHFDGLTAMTFDDLVADGSPALTLGSRLRLDLSGPVSVEPQNISLHPDAVILKRTLHQCDFEPSKARKDIETVLSSLMESGLNELVPRSLYSSVEDLMSFQEAFSKDNDQLKAEFFGSTVSESPLFRPPNPRNLKFGDSVDPSFLALVVKVLAGCVGTSEAVAP